MQINLGDSGTSAGTPAAPLRAPSENVLSATASPDSVTVGDSILFTIALKVPKNAQIIQPEAEKGKFGDFVVLSSQSDIKAGGGDHDTAVYNYYITTFKPENCAIPQLQFLAGIDTLFDTLATPPVPVSVISAIPPGIPDSALAIRDLKAQQKAGRASLESLWLLSLVALAAVIWYFLERRAKRFSTSAIPTVPLKPPYEEALELLSELEGKKYLEQGRVREHVFELSEIFKRYIGRRYDTIAPELTTEEIVAWLEFSGISREMRVSAEWFFRTSDRVKFAKWSPDSQTVSRFMKEVRTFLEATKPETALPYEQKTQKMGAAE
jgi:hypothetical protein